MDEYPINESSKSNKEKQELSEIHIPNLTKFYIIITLIIIRYYILLLYMNNIYTYIIINILLLYPYSLI